MNAPTDSAAGCAVSTRLERGCQYTSGQFVTTANELGVRLSVGHTERYRDNALGEVVPATIEGELLDHRSWPTHTAARRALDSTRLLARAALEVAIGVRALPTWRGGLTSEREDSASRTDP